MRELNDFEKRNLATLTENSVSVFIIEPTKTGLNKSIMDATGTVRGYLKAKGIHDYSLQSQGPDNKIVIVGYLYQEFSRLNCSTSLYRPNTKKGDPRIWFSKLGKVARANDIIAVTYFDHSLHVINISSLLISELLASRLINPIQELIRSINSTESAASRELLGMIRTLAQRGPIPSMLNADTSVGRTLETALGIDINSSKMPDYKGIELKSFRTQRGNRKTLFAQVPDWSSSKFKSSSEILDAFGYVRGDDFKLYCTVSTITINSQGLSLRIEPDIDQLIETSQNIKFKDFVVWQLDKLHRRLSQKHKETFWVAAETLQIDGVDHFQYKEIEHTKRPIESQFDILLEQGVITVDHLIKRNSLGRVVEKGPLFKIKPNSLNLLFPPSEIYSLL